MLKPHIFLDPSARLAEALAKRAGRRENIRDFSLRLEA